MSWEERKTRNGLRGWLAGLIFASALGAPLAAKFAKDAEALSASGPPPVTSGIPKDLPPTPELVEIPLVIETPTPEITPTLEIETKEVLSIAWMPETVTRWEPLINEIADQYKIEPNLVAIMMLCESGGNFCAVSPSAALGLLQVLKGNAKGLNLFAPETNILAGVHYSTLQYNRFGDWDKAILAYNGGPENVRRGTIPAKSKLYLEWVKGMWNEASEETSPTFQDWFDGKGKGKVLVEKARQLYENETRLKAVEFATQQWHKPYRMGGEGPDIWDCSALVQAAYRHAGIEIPRNATSQWRHAGRVLSDDEPRLPGDLVFFTLDGVNSDHVGMIIFPSSVFIEATGSFGYVKASSLNPNNVIYREDLAQRILGFKRLE